MSKDPDRESYERAVHSTNADRATQRRLALLLGEQLKADNQRLRAELREAMTLLGDTARRARKAEAEADSLRRRLDALKKKARTAKPDSAKRRAAK